MDEQTSMRELFRKRVFLLLALSAISLVLISLTMTIQSKADAKDPTASSLATKLETTSVPKKGDEKKMQIAMFGAGCFWGVEETFRTLPGVVKTEVGYSGGTLKNPTYEDVCTDRTGHAEVVRIEYDPSKISYDKLLDVFYANHNPTTSNRQGPDVGTQYRSVVFYTTPEQEAEAKAATEKWSKSGKFSSPIVTQIVPAHEFYKAEDYHQQYLKKRGLNVCH